MENIGYLPSWLDKDKTIQEINSRFDSPNEATDYFLYSLLNVIKKQIGESNDC